MSAHDQAAASVLRRLWDELGEKEQRYVSVDLERDVRAVLAREAATAKADGESAKATVSGGSGSTAEQQAPHIASAATKPLNRPWECPRCGRINAWWVASCRCKPPASPVVGAGGACGRHGVYVGYSCPKCVTQVKR